ncbi:alpha-amylase family glycosyl hydrolase [Chloroflexota bacterium]
MGSYLWDPNGTAVRAVGNLTGPFYTGIMGVVKATIQTEELSSLLRSQPLEGTMRHGKPLRREFHISRRARDYYQFDGTLFSLSGNVIFANFHAARLFAQKMNERRDLVSFPEHGVRAGQINAMGLIDEILHYLIAAYRKQKNPFAMEKALVWLQERVGESAVDEMLRRFAAEFPPVAVYRGELTSEAYLEGETGGESHRELLLEEMLMLWLENDNPAFSPFKELFDDESLAKETAYSQVAPHLYEFFETQPGFGPRDENLLDVLRGPARAHPYSLTEQLEFLRLQWGTLLDEHLYRLLGSLDLIQEEDKPVFLGPGPALVYEFGDMDLELERFSPDLDWMPRLVLIAKNAYVWLNQLSRKHNRDIGHLDQVPDEELDTLARWGFTGLWLIGLWERSPASRTVKQLMGNPEAVASAYSLYDYQIAADLGGEEAFRNLKERAWQRGIRMASDMVPNHVGIYSRWVVEHPEWFVGLDYSPFPGYRFAGPDLSADERVGIYLEDHYYDRSDAAVVFKRLDRWTGSERYIYHGNDGTSMPWNDTAQLNYLNPEVREAVIQTILHVARQTPVVRFDAAMTLTKKHFQRLWFPEPGTGGAIPTRAEHGLTKSEFDAAMPSEFWREVVDRVAAEAPDTLLLAEAFWLLEGYFVRTLGMHRVYNSAFMNMLRDEDNAKYRQVIKNTLEFDPQILKRFVSFMNNPDEDTAVEQFGKGDKYFGICTMLATLPGLPMFGHGQIEGYSEKYGMEYRRAYWDEQPDVYLVERHEREVFPLLGQRHLFAGVERFLLYDFYTPEGRVNEDVFAYSNCAGNSIPGAGERALVVYHNKFDTVRGRLKTSVAFSARSQEPDGDKGSDVEGRALIQKDLAEGLGLRNEAKAYYVFRDHLTGLEYIRNGKELWEGGLFVELDAYKCHAFLDWREVWDNEWQQYAQLASYLDGRGVPSIEDALREAFLQPVHQPFRELVNPTTFRRLLDSRLADPGTTLDVELLDEVEARVLQMLRKVEQFASGDGPAQVLSKEVRSKLETLLQLLVLDRHLDLSSLPPCRDALKLLEDHLDGDDHAVPCLLGWLFTHPLGKVVDQKDAQQQGRSLMDEWLLGKLLLGTFRELGLDQEDGQSAVGITKILISHSRWFEIEETSEVTRTYGVLLSWLRDRDVQQFLQVNRYRGVLWFNHEAFERLLALMVAVAVVEIGSESGLSRQAAAKELSACCRVIQELDRAEESSGYQVVELMEAAKG